MSTAYGNFHDGCRDTGSLNPTLPVCYLFNEATTRGGRGFGGCDLTGIPLSNDRHLANLGMFLSTCDQQQTSSETNYPRRIDSSEWSRHRNRRISVADQDKHEKSCRWSTGNATLPRWLHHHIHL